MQYKFMYKQSMHVCVYMYIGFSEGQALVYFHTLHNSKHNVRLHMAGTQYAPTPKKNGSTFVFIKVYILLNIGKRVRLGGVEVTVRFWAC